MANDLVVQNAKTVKDLVAQQMNEFRAAIPKQAGLEVEQFIRVALTTLRINRKLLECSPESLLSGMMQAAQDGFSLDPNMGQAYLVPFRNNKTGTMDAQYIRGYRGLISLMTRYGEVRYVTAHIVYENDTFDIEYGQNERLTHKPYFGSDSRGEALGAYAVAHFKDGGSTFVWMSIDEIEKIRKTSKTYDKKEKRNYGPWHDWTEAMQKKCPIRQLHKYLPMVPSLMVYHEAAATDEAEELGYNVNFLPEPETGNVTDALKPGTPEDFPPETEKPNNQQTKRGRPPKAEKQIPPDTQPTFACTADGQQVGEVAAVPHDDDKDYYQELVEGIKIIGNDKWECLREEAGLPKKSISEYDVFQIKTAWNKVNAAVDKLS